MKISQLLSMAALVLVGTIMIGCAEEDNFIDGQPTNVKNVVTLTTTINLQGGEATTRALDAKGHKTFAEGDAIAVFYKNTSDKTIKTAAGVSNISADGKTATISVTLTDPAENSQLRFVYPFTMAKDQNVDGAIDDANTIDYDYLKTKQNGLLGDLGSYFDLAVFDGAMSGNALPASITLENKLTICAFTIKNSDGSQDLTSSITNLTVSDGTDTYTIGRTPNVGPIYVAMRPVANANIELTATHNNGQHYTKSLTDKTYAVNNLYLLGMKMTESFKTYTTVPDGTLLKLGDQISSGAAFHINGVPQTLSASNAPFTLVRANVAGSTVTEADDGTHYVFKDRYGYYYGKDVNLLASEGSDGLYVVGYYSPDQSYTMLSHVNLANVTAAYTAHTYDYIYGTLGTNVKVSIAAGATVWLAGVSINQYGNFAGITCEGDATIDLVDGTTNTVSGYDNYPGIYVPQDKTLTIRGTGSLNASTKGYGAGIGGGHEIACGNIVINDGTITATGTAFAAGIGGGGHLANCGYITINGGTIIAKAGIKGAGIGSGSESSCGKINICGGTVTATGGEGGAGIGCGDGSSCGDINICGGTVTATGGEYGAGIGSGSGSSCGDITITGDVTSVIATKGQDAEYIGEGDNGSCGLITIDDVGFPRPTSNFNHLSSSAEGNTWTLTKK